MVAVVMVLAACGKPADPPTPATRVASAAPGVPGAQVAGAINDYKLKSMAIEAQVQLNRLGKMAKIVFIEAGKYPAGTTALTPAAKCCDGPNHRCVVSPADWEAPAWRALDFQIEDPGYFRYSYTGTDTTFTATAVGDLDCDGTEITYTLVGTVATGSPTVVLTQPVTLD